MTSPADEMRSEKFKSKSIYSFEFVQTIRLVRLPDLGTRQKEINLVER